MILSREQRNLTLILAAEISEAGQGQSRETGQMLLQ